MQVISYKGKMLSSGDPAAVAAALGDKDNEDDGQEAAVEENEEGDKGVQVNVHVVHGGEWNDKW